MPTAEKQVVEPLNFKQKPNLEVRSTQSPQLSSILSPNHQLKELMRVPESDKKLNRFSKEQPDGGGGGMPEFNMTNPSLKNESKSVMFNKDDKISGVESTEKRLKKASSTLEHKDIFSTV